MKAFPSIHSLKVVTYSIERNCYRWMPISLGKWGFVLESSTRISHFQYADEYDQGFFKRLSRLDLPAFHATFDKEHDVQLYQYHYLVKSSMGAHVTLGILPTSVGTPEFRVFVSFH